jgi:hypothetical protein
MREEGVVVIGDEEHAARLRTFAIDRADQRADDEGNPEPQQHRVRIAETAA